MMILFCCVLSCLATFFLSYFGRLVTSFKDLWIVVLLLIGFYVGFVLLLILILFVLTLFVNKNKEREKPSKFYNFVFHFMNNFLLTFCRIKIKVSGLEKLDENTKYLFVCNHRSGFDPLVLIHSLKKRQIIMISKQENFKLPIVGSVACKMGYLAMNRTDTKEAIKTIIKASKRLDMGYDVCIFPEGTRNKNDVNLLPFKNGAFKIAQKAGVPVAVFCINGTEKIFKKSIFRKTTVYLDLLDVISGDDAKEKSTVEMGEITTKMIGERIKILNENATN